MLTSGILSGVISGTVAYIVETNTATFRANDGFDPSLRYTATVSTAATDTEVPAHALAFPFVWSFTTGGCTQQPIALGTAAAFAALGAEVSGTCNVTGDVGSSPRSISGITPKTVIGTLHDNDAAAATALVDLTTAYNDAAGRSLCPIDVTGNLGGRTLAPGLYRATNFARTMEVTSFPLTLDGGGDEDAVFIFQMDSTLTITRNNDVVLSNGAQAKNVFWQVGETVTFANNVGFTGTILAQDTIDFDVNSVLAGRALSLSGSVLLDTSAIVVP